MSNGLERVDHASIKTNQATIIIVLLIAYIANQPWLVALTSLVMLLGTAFQRPGFGFIYFGLLKPRDWVQPEIVEDNPEPHRFAQGFGGIVLAGASLVLFLSSGVFGWALTWLVVGLAALNLFIGFCAGCAIYYWLNRLHLPGFVKAPPAGTLPGMRPQEK